MFRTKWKLRYEGEPREEPGCELFGKDIPIKIFLATAACVCAQYVGDCGGVLEAYWASSVVGITSVGIVATISFQICHAFSKVPKEFVVFTPQTR